MSIGIPKIRCKFPREPNKVALQIFQFERRKMIGLAYVEPATRQRMNESQKLAGAFLKMLTAGRMQCAIMPIMENHINKETMASLRQRS
jgi:hypothetical protein